MNPGNFCRSYGVHPCRDEALRAGGSRGRLSLVILLSELTITLLNTFALYVYSKLYGNYSPAFVFGTLAARLLVCAVKSLSYGAVIPELLMALKKTSQ